LLLLSTVAVLVFSVLPGQLTRTTTLVTFLYT
jgi:hypothetical protein